MPVALRPMTLGELLDKTFSLYRTHFTVFVGIMGLPQLLILALQLARPAMAPPSEDLSAAFARLGSILLWGLVIGVISLVLGSIAQGATVVAVSDLHLGRPTGIGRAYSAVRHRIGILCLIGFLFALCVGFGLLLFVIPGILLALAWSLLVPIAVIEDTGFGDAATRSRFLTRGYRRWIFVTGVLYFVLTMVVAGIWQVPIVMASVASMRAGTPGEMPAWTLVLAPIGTFVTTCLTGPLITIALSLIYYDMRVRKEGFDLEHMMAQLDRTAPEDPAAV